MMAIDPALKSTPAAGTRLAEQGRSQLIWQSGLQIAVRYALLSIAAIFFVAPFLWVFLASFKPEVEIFKYIFPASLKTFIPQTWTLENFTGLMDMKPYPFTYYMGNSIFVAISVTFSSLIVNTMAAYAFAKLRFPGRDILFALFLITSIIPFEILAIPMYLQIRAFNWVNHYEALIIPWIANAAGIFLLRQFFLEIPQDLIEAARIDGATHLGAFRHIVIPNCVPALITFALIRFQASWDAFLWPLIVAPNPEKRVIQVAIATFTTEVQTQWGLTFAASTLATVPIILLFLFLQRYYVRSVIMSGVKG